jgi:hypothetical protein
MFRNYAAAVTAVAESWFNKIESANQKLLIVRVLPVERKRPAVAIFCALDRVSSKRKLREGKEAGGIGRKCPDTHLVRDEGVAGSNPAHSDQLFPYKIRLRGMIWGTKPIFPPHYFAWSGELPTLRFRKNEGSKVRVLSKPPPEKFPMDESRLFVLAPIAKVRE